MGTLAMRIDGCRHQLVEAGERAGRRMKGALSDILRGDAER